MLGDDIAQTSEYRSMQVFKDFSEIKAAVGSEIGVSVDVERAKPELPGGTTIAHGLLTLGLIPGFLRSVMRLQGLKSSLNYGSNRIRDLSPVPAGSRLRGRVAIAAADDAPPDGLCATYCVTVEIEGSERPACIAEVISMHYR